MPGQALNDEAPQRLVIDEPGFRRHVLFTQLPLQTLIGIGIILVYIMIAVFGDWVAPFPPNEQHFADTLQAPSTLYRFGTDEFGRDIFSRVLLGTRNVLFLASTSTVLGLSLGSFLGLVAGYFGGRIDSVIMRSFEVLLAFPILLLALLILSLFGNGLLNLIIGIGIIFAPRVALVVRAATLDIRTKDYLLAAKAIGSPHHRIMLREILPNIAGPLVMEGAMRFSYAILLSATLGFLGLGVQPPAPDWGLMINDGRSYMLIAPWIVGYPSLAISMLVIGVNLMSDGIARWLGVRVKP